MATILLAGGLSKRMGRDKACLAIGGSTFARLLADRFAGVFGEVILVVRRDQQCFDLDVVVVQDQYEGVGPLGGLHAGLLASSDDENFVLACDMPFADPELARYIMSRTAGHDAVVPMPARGPEPLFAGYRKSVLPVVESNIEAGRLSMRQTLDKLNVLYLAKEGLREHDPELRSFWNVNTPEEYERALQMLGDAKTVQSCGECPPSVGPE